MPRGLYCLLMTYDPSSDDADTPLNIPQFVHSSIKSSTSNVKIKSLGMNASRSIELPESAPLIFPAVDLGDPLFHPFRWTRRFFSNYCDRKAQARYAKLKPPRPLAVMAPAEQTPVGPQSWLAVQAIDPVLAGNTAGAAVGKEPNKKRRKPRRGTGKVWFKENILYLMIVNLPSRDELAAARASNGRKASTRLSQT